MERKKIIIIASIICVVLISFGVVFQILTAKKMEETNISLSSEEEKTDEPDPGADTGPGIIPGPGVFIEANEETSAHEAPPAEDDMDISSDTTE